MKVKFEAQKTSLRLSRDEFHDLKNFGTLSEKTTLPNGKFLNFIVNLEAEQYFSFDDDEMRFILPNQLIRAHKPAKSGISFKFQCGNGENHLVVFEVDIKKPPLGVG